MICDVSELIINGGNIVTSLVDRNSMMHKYRVYSFVKLCNNDHFYQLD